MKKIICVFALSFACLVVRAQVIVGNYPVQIVFSNPTGNSCNPSTYPVTEYAPSGLIFTCQNGTVAQITSGGGPPTGAAGGDLSGSYPNPAVAQINGAAVPLNAAFIATNGLGQLAAAAYTPAHSGANSDITSLTGLTTPLAVTEGGNGTSSLYFNGAPSGTGGQVFVQNQTVYYSFTVSNTVTVGFIDYRIATADNTGNLYDVGVLSVAGSLLFHLGATAGSTFAPSTGGKTNNAISGGATYTLYPGTYLFAYTTNCAGSCAVLGQTTGGVSVFYNSTSGGATSNGVLTSITTPTKSVETAAPAPGFSLHN